MATGPVRVLGKQQGGTGGRAQGCRHRFVLENEASREDSGLAREPDPGVKREDWGAAVPGQHLCSLSLL